MDKAEIFWQWLVLTSAVIVNAISGGITFSFGVIYTDIRDRLETPPSHAFVTGGLAFACSCFIVPFTLALTSKLGSRIVTVIGSMVATIGLLLCAVAPTIHFYYVFFWILVGKGYGMIAVASFIIVREYFNNKPGLAMTLFHCGFPAGVFIFSLIIRVLYDNFSYHGMFLISSAIMMNGVACGLVFRPIINTVPREVGVYEQMNNPVENSVRYAPNAAELDEPSSFAHQSQPKEDRSQEDSDKESLRPKQAKMHKAVEGPSEEMVVSTLERSLKFDDTCLYESDDKDDKDDDSEKTTESEPKPESSKPLDYPDNSTDNVDAITNEPPSSKELKPVSKTLLDVIIGVSEAKQICQWRLILYICACMVYSLGYGVPFSLYPDIAKYFGYEDSKAIWTLSLIGLSSTISVIVFGAVTRIYMDRLRGASILIVALCSVAFGLVVGFGRYYTDLGILLLICLGIGFFNIPFYFLKEHVLLEIIDDEPDVTPYMAMTTWFSGFGFFIGVPVAGWLRERDGDYNSCFVLMACSCCVASVFLIPLFIWKRVSKK